MDGQNTLLAGVGRAEISTTRRPVNDPLFAKALVLDDGRLRLAVIAMDAVAIGGICDIGDDFLGKLRERLAGELGIPADCVLVNATHTHTAGPMLCEPGELLERTFNAVRDACGSLRRVTEGAGLGREECIAINRTLRLRGGRQWSIRQSNPCPPEAEVEALGPTDPEIGILRLDGEDGQPFAVLYTFSCHPLLGVPGGAVTANYPGFASRVIEDVTGAAAIFLQGTLGDMTELLYKDVTRPMDSEPVGRMLGLAVLRALRGIPTGQASLAVRTKTVRLPRQFDMPAQIEKLRREQEEILCSLRFTTLNFKSFLPLYLKYKLDPDHPSDYVYRYMHMESIGNSELTALDAQNRANMDKYLQNIAVMERLCQIQDDIGTLEKHYRDNLAAGEDTVACEVVAMRVGDFVMVSSPAEMLVEVGQNVKNASPFAHTWVISPSNGYVHYGPPAADYGKGGYEVTECMLAPGWQEIYEQTAQELLRGL